MTAPAASQPAPTASIWEDFIDVFYAPAQVFARRRDGRFWPALVTFALVSLVLFFVFRGMWDAVTSVAFETAMRSNPDVTPEQMAAARANAQKFAVVGGVFQSVVGFPLAIVLNGLVVWLGGKIFGAALNVAQAITISTYANFPRLLGLIVSGSLFAAGHPAQVASPYSVTVSPLRLLDESGLSPLVAALVSRFDLFVLWATVLIAIGARVIGRASWGGAAGVATVAFVLGTAFAAVSAAR